MDATLAVGLTQNVFPLKIEYLKQLLCHFTHLIPLSHYINLLLLSNIFLQSLKLLGHWQEIFYVENKMTLDTSYVCLKHLPRNG